MTRKVQANKPTSQQTYKLRNWRRIARKFRRHYIRRRCNTHLQRISTKRHVGASSGRSTAGTVIQHYRFRRFGGISQRPSKRVLVPTLAAQPKKGKRISTGCPISFRKKPAVVCTSLRIERLTTAAGKHVRKLRAFTKFRRTIKKVRRNLRRRRIFKFGAALVRARKRTAVRLASQQSDEADVSDVSDESDVYGDVEWYNDRSNGCEQSSQPVQVADDKDPTPVGQLHDENTGSSLMRMHCDLPLDISDVSDDKSDDMLSSNLEEVKSLPKPAAVVGACRVVSVSDIDSDEDFSDLPISTKATTNLRQSLDYDDLSDDDELDSINCQPPKAGEHNNNNNNNNTLHDIDSNKSSSGGENTMPKRVTRVRISSPDDDHSGTMSPEPMQRRRRCSSTPPPDLNLRIREQLALMKMGKRKEPLLADSIGCVRSKKLRISNLTDIPQPSEPSRKSPISNNQLDKRHVEIPIQSLSKNSVAKIERSPSNTSNHSDFYGFEPTSQQTPTAADNVAKTNSRSAPATATAAPVDKTTTLAANVGKIANTFTPVVENTTLAVAGTTFPTAPVAETATPFKSESADTIKLLTANITEAATSAPLDILPAPLVPASRRFELAAFVSESLDSFLEDNAIDHNGKRQKVDEKPVVRHQAIDAALVTDTSQPPPFACPVRPLHSERPRTVAEKRRQLAQDVDNVQVRMLDNELFVFRALNRRTSGSGNRDRTPFTHMAAVLQEGVPFSRECWRAACWMATRPGRYYYQTTMTAGGTVLSLSGGHGNHKQSSAGFTLRDDVSANATALAANKAFDPRRCRARCRPLGMLRIRNLDEWMEKLYPRTTTDSSSSDSTANGSSRLIASWPQSRVSCRPCPLSKKPLFAIRTSVDADLGPLEIMNMPSVQLEVWPDVDRPLPEHVRAYLKILAPTERITEQWAQFAVSTLCVPSTPSVGTVVTGPDTTTAVTKTRRGRVISRPAYAESPPPTTRVVKDAVPLSISPVTGFCFDIPYNNGQSRLLVRSRTKQVSMCASHDNGDALDVLDVSDGREAPLQFDRHLNPRDAVAVQVAAVLRSMMDAVSVACMEAAVVRDDPDGRAAEVAPPVVDAVKVQSPIVQGTETFRRDAARESGIRRELKRLNATIIDNYEAPMKENCTELFCKLGCVCDSLAVHKNHPLHCSKIECMFACSCSRKTIRAMEHRNSSIEQIRHRANARLAKEEREFRATVVLSEDRTIYIPNRENVGKRNKRVPKRYHDEDADEFSTPASLSRLAPPLPTSLPPPPPTKRISDGGEWAKSVVPKVSSPIAERKPELMTDAIRQQRIQNELNRARHCAVTLERLPMAVGKLQPWCMIHHLYKCFCKLRTAGAANGRTIMSGVPMSAADDTADAADTSDIQTDSTPERPAAKIRRYTFDRTDELPTQPISAPRFGSRASSKSCSRSSGPRSSPRSAAHAAATAAVRAAPFPAPSGAASSTARHVAHERPTNTHSDSDRNAMNAHRQDALSGTVHIASSPETSPTASRETSPDRVRVQQSSSINITKCINNSIHEIVDRQRHNKHIKQMTRRDCIQWRHFCALFHTGQIFMWEVYLQSRDVLLCVTLCNVLPVVPSAQRVTNVTAMPYSRLPLIAQLLLRKGMDSSLSDQLAVLICPKVGYYQVLGFIYSRLNYLQDEAFNVTARQVRDPNISIKVHTLISLLTKNQNAIQLAHAKAFSRPERILQKPPLAALAEAMLAEHSMDKPIMTNIPLSEPRCVNKMFLPIPEHNDYRWMMLTLGTDCTHILIPSWREILPVQRLTIAARMARSSGKTVKLNSPQNDPSVYVTPKAPRLVFIGPYALDASMDLQLLCMHNNNFFKVQDLEIIHQMNERPVTKTIGCWLLSPSTGAKMLASYVSARAPPTNAANDDALSDDDCMIVETPVDTVGEQSPNNERMVTKSTRTPDAKPSPVPLLVSISKILDTISSQSNIPNTDVQQSVCTGEHTDTGKLPKNTFGRIIPKTVTRESMHESPARSRSDHSAEKEIAQGAPSLNSTNINTINAELDNVPCPPTIQLVTPAPVSITINLNEPPKNTHPGTSALPTVTQPPVTEINMKPGQMRPPPTPRQHTQQQQPGAQILRRRNSLLLPPSCKFSQRPTTSSSIKSASASVSITAVSTPAQAPPADTLPTTTLAPATITLTAKPAGHRTSYRVGNERTDVRNGTAILSNPNFAVTSDAKLSQYPAISGVYSANPASLQGSYKPARAAAAGKRRSTVSVTNAHTQQNFNQMAASIQRRLPSSVVVTATRRSPQMQQPQVQQQEVNLPMASIILLPPPIPTPQLPPPPPMKRLPAVAEPNIVRPVAIDEIITVLSDEDDQDDAKAKAASAKTKDRTAHMVRPHQRNAGSGGWLVCELGASMGRIEVRVLSTGFKMRLYDQPSQQWTPVIRDRSQANKMIKEHLNQHVYAFYPRELIPQWTIVHGVPLNDDIAAYPVYNPKQWPKWSVVAADLGCVNLHCDSEKDEDPPVQCSTVFQLNLLRAAYFSQVTREDIRKQSWSVIVNQIAAFCRLEQSRGDDFTLQIAALDRKIRRNKAKLAVLEYAVAFPSKTEIVEILDD